MLVTCKVEVEQDVLETISKFANHRQVEIENYVQDEGFEYTRLYLAKVYEVSRYRNMDCVATIHGSISRCYVTREKSNFISNTLEVVSIQSEFYDNSKPFKDFQIIWLTYQVRTNFED